MASRSPPLPGFEILNHLQLPMPRKRFEYV
jgi:hypothetical protein